MGASRQSWIVGHESNFSLVKMYVVGVYLSREPYQRPGFSGGAPWSGRW